MDASFEFRSGDMVATASGMELAIGYDASLSARQAYLVGRSGNFIPDLKTKILTKYINVKPLFRYDTGIIDQILDDFSASLDIPAQDALFSFKNGKVTAFKPSLPGRIVNADMSRQLFADAIQSLIVSPAALKVIEIPVDTVEPVITTDKANIFGIKELIGTGYSEFSGSITGRIHNVALAADRFNGVLISPGETLSFNKTLGDVSAATGYQQAYIIKDGRTILGDGGGVCQVSTTLFRAALNAGLPIVERHAHAYRVHYYEEGGFKAGMDATVFDPTADLKITNDTGGYVLIQTRTDLDNLNLTFDLYGQKDSRISEVYDIKVWDITPPPEPLYQDDPTLKTGVVKQVDWAAWGAKASFKYRVTRGSEILQDSTFFSSYRPWKAVYLKGTME
jgi:vancomycin resistance protein YoaR